MIYFFGALLNLIALFAMYACEIADHPLPRILWIVNGVGFIANAVAYQRKSV